MRGMEIDRDLLDILNQSDARKSLGGLRRAISQSRSNVSKLRSNTVYSIESLTDNLEDVARAGLGIEKTLQRLKSANKNDVRIRLLSDLVVVLDSERQALSKRLNAALSDYNEADQALTQTTNVLTRRKTLAPIFDKDVSGGGSGRGKKSVFGSTDISPSLRYTPSGAGFTPPTTAPRPRLRTKQRIVEGERSNLTLPSTFLRQSLNIDREELRANREYREQQVQFQADSQRKIEAKLDRIADLLKKSQSAGGSGGGFGLPDLPDFGGKGKRGRGGRLGRFGGVSGILKGGIGALLADQFLNKENTTGAGSALGGLLGALGGGPLAGALGAYIGNDVEESLNSKGKAAQQKRLEDKLNEQQKQLQNGADIGISGRFNNIKNLLTGQIGIGDFLSGSFAAAIAAQQAQNNTAPQYTIRKNIPPVTLNPGDELPGINSDETKIEVKPDATVIINTNRLTMGGSRNIGEGISSTDTTMGGLGMGSGGIQGGGSSGGVAGGALSNNTPALYPNAIPGLGQTPSQAQEDLRQRAAQSKMPSYDLGMSPNAQGGAGAPKSIPGNTETVPNSIAGLPINTNQGGGSFDKGGDWNRVAKGKEEYAARGAAIVEHYKSQGVPEHVAAGIAGNAETESQFNTKAENLKGESSHGLFQWNDAGGGKRWQQAQAWAQEKGRDIRDPRTQLDYAKEEASKMRMPGGGTVWDAMMQAKTSKEASDIWLNHFEKPKERIQNSIDRGQNAENALRSYQSGKYASAPPVSVMGPNGIGNAPRTSLDSVMGGATPTDPKNLMFARPGENATNIPAGSIATPNVKELQSSQASIRRLPIQNDLRERLQFAAEKLGVQVEVGSGGQSAIGTGGPRTGSTRHDDGGAADLKLYTTDENGNRRLLDMRRPEDQAKMQAFSTEAVRAGATGIGAGMGYMGPSTMHIGGGSATSWGGAPWIGDAHRKGMEGQREGKAEFEAWKASKIEQQKAQDTAGIAPNATTQNFAPPPLETKPNSAETPMPRTLGGMMKRYAQENDIDTAESRKLPSPGDLADQANAAKMVVETLKNTSSIPSPLSQAFGPKGQFEQMMERAGKSSDNTIALPPGMSEVQGPYDLNTMNRMSPYANEKNKPTSWQQDPETGRWKPRFGPVDENGNSFSDYLKQKSKDGVDIPGYREGNVIPSIGSEDGVQNNLKGVQRGLDYDKLSNSPAYGLSDEGFANSIKARNRLRRDEYSPERSLSLRELREISGVPNSQSETPKNDGLLGVDYLGDNKSSYSMTERGTSEGSTRQSVAPPPSVSEDVKAAPISNTPSESSGSSDKKVDSTASANPVGGGDQAEMSQIPVKNGDFGLAVLNEKDLA